MNGDEACCEGALAAACRFFAAYPITPATEVAERMSERLPQVDSIFIQMEDELASMAAILGASRGGAGCHIGDCLYLNANHWTERRITRLRKKMEKLGLRSERLQLEWISAAEGVHFRGDGEEGVLASGRHRERGGRKQADSSGAAG